MSIPDTSLYIAQEDGLGGLIKVIGHSIKIGIFTAMPGEVLEWKKPVLEEEKPAFVDIKLQMRFQLQNDDGSVENIEYPPLPNVPIIYPGFAGMYMRGPLAVGETGVVLFCMRGLDTWKNKGGPLDPVDRFILDINNGIFIPGVRHGSNTPDIDPTKYVLGAEDDSYKLEVDIETKDLTLTTSGPNIRIQSAAEVTVEAPLIKLGEGATLGNARLNDPVAANAALTTFIAQVSALFNADPGPVLSAPGLVTPPGPIIGTISSASTKVLSE